MNKNKTPEFSGAFASLCSILTDKNIRFTTHAEEKRISLSIVGKVASYNCNFLVNDDDSLLCFYLRYPIAVRDEKYRASACELITRATYGLPVGNFEFDFRDGEIRFHVSQFIGSFPLERDVVDSVVHAALRAADRYFPSLAQHLYSGVTPEDAVYTAELDYHSSQVQEPSPAVKKPAPHADTPQPDTRTE